MPPRNTFLKTFSKGKKGSEIPSILKYTKKMMMMRWTHEAGAEMRSVFLCNTYTAEATADAFVALNQSSKRLNFNLSKPQSNIKYYLQSGS